RGRARKPCRRPPGSRSAARGRPRSPPRSARAAPAARRGAPLLCKWPFAQSSQNKGPLSGPLLLVPKGKASDADDVRSLQALLALHDFELDALTLGQRLVPLHPDRGEVDEDVLPLLALDEAIALLVREPLDGALSQLILLTTT